MNTPKRIEEINQWLYQLSPERIQEIADFVEFIYSKSVVIPKVQNLEGIWQGLGFEQIALEQEIETIRTEVESNLNS